MGSRLLEILLKRSGVDPLIKARVQLGTHPNHHLAAHVFERSNKGVQTQNHQAEHPQRVLVVAGQHAVVNLQHVQRWRKHQHIDKQAEDSNGTKNSPETRQRPGDFPLLLFYQNTINKDSFTASLLLDSV